MAVAEDLRIQLLKLCDERYQTERWKDRGTVSPNPSKLIAEGIRAARKAIESTPLSGDARGYLAATRARVEETREHVRQNPTSEEGWNDEDGWMLGGLTSITGEIDRISAELDRQDRGLGGWIRRMLRWGDRKKHGG